MNVGQLKRLLEGYEDGTEVRLMSQPWWPLEYDIEGVWEAAPEPNACGECGRPKDDPIHIDIPDDTDDPEAYVIRALEGTGIHPLDVHDFERYNDFTPQGDPEEGVVYIVEGTQLAYGTKTAWEEVERTW